VYRIYFARCMNIFNSLLAQLVKYDVHTTRKINAIHAIFIKYYHYRLMYYDLSRSMGQRSRSQHDMAWRIRYTSSTEK